MKATQTEYKLPIVKYSSSANVKKQSLNQKDNFQEAATTIL